MTTRGQDWHAGDWMQTYTGKAFWPLDPRIEDLDPRDIAHALSLLCRYGGHVKRFYSVAEHCVLMSRAVAPEHALWALLHDAAEAYVVDVPRPLKLSMPDYRAAEAAIMDVICERFGLHRHEPKAVKDADNAILNDEREALMAPPPLPWRAIEQVPRLGVTIRCWAPTVAEYEYARRLQELTGVVAA